MTPSDPVEEVRVMKPPEPVVDDVTHELDVHELFERLKAETEPEEPEQPEAAPATEPADGADGADGAEPRPEPEAQTEPEPEVETEDETEAETAAPDAPLLQRRDAELDAIEHRLARRLKRVLADEQNEVLDRLRRLGGGRVDAGSLLPPTDRHAAAYAEAAAEELATAAGAGGHFSGVSVATARRRRSSTT